MGADMCALFEGGVCFHMVASRFEVAEKASLEVPLSGCAVVRDAMILPAKNPSSKSRVRSRVLANGLGEECLSTWDCVAELTLQGYLQVLEGKVKYLWVN